MVNPGVFRLQRGRNAHEFIVANIAYGVAHPIHQRLGGPDEVADRGGVDGEEIWETRALDAHVGSRAVGKFILQRLPTFASDFHAVQRPGDGVVSRGEDDDIQVVFGRAGLDALGGDALDGGLAHVDQ